MNKEDCIGCYCYRDGVIGDRCLGMGLKIKEITSCGTGRLLRFPTSRTEADAIRRLIDIKWPNLEKTE